MIDNISLDKRAESRDNLGYDTGFCWRTGVCTIPFNLSRAHPEESMVIHDPALSRRDQHDYITGRGTQVLIHTTRPGTYDLVSSAWHAGFSADATPIKNPIKSWPYFTKA